MKYLLLLAAIYGAQCFPRQADDPKSCPAGDIKVENGELEFVNEKLPSDEFLANTIGTLSCKDGFKVAEGSAERVLCLEGTWQWVGGQPGRCEDPKATTTTTPQPSSSSSSSSTEASSSSSSSSSSSTTTPSSSSSTSTESSSSSSTTSPSSSSTSPGSSSTTAPSSSTADPSSSGCSSEAKVQNGKVEASKDGDSFSTGTVGTVKCEDEFTLKKGSASRSVCISGEWEWLGGGPAECEPPKDPNSCDQPLEVENGEVDYSKEMIKEAYPPNTVANLKCKDSFKLKENSAEKAICLNKKWEWLGGSAAECIKEDKEEGKSTTPSPSSSSTTSSTTPSPSTTTLSESCLRYAMEGECERNTCWMWENCLEACVEHGEQQLGASDGVADDRKDPQQCCEWAVKGECDGNRQWMKDNCAKSCAKYGKIKENVTTPKPDENKSSEEEKEESKEKSKEESKEESKEKKRKTNKGCKKLSSISHGNVDYNRSQKSGRYPKGTKAMLECRKGYFTRDQAKIQVECDNGGKWSGKLSKCDGVCPYGVSDMRSVGNVQDLQLWGNFFRTKGTSSRSKCKTMCKESDSCHACIFDTSSKKCYMRSTKQFMPKGEDGPCTDGRDLVDVNGKWYEKVCKCKRGGSDSADNIVRNQICMHRLNPYKVLNKKC